jgi:hypothetical protein
VWSEPIMASSESCYPTLLFDPSVSLSHCLK